MYLAKTLNSSEVQTPLYVDILEKILNHTSEDGKENIDNAILEAQKIVLKEKEIYSINHRYYFLVTTLLGKYYDGLKKIENQHIDDHVYSDILDLLR
jgi:hypothetical protein